MARHKQKITQHDITEAALEALLARNDGHISPRVLLDAARDPDSPFHDHFEWDDEAAGEQYRLAQASQLLRRWKGVIMKIDAESKVVTIKTTRRLQSPSGSREKGGASYQPVESVLSDPAKREDMIRTVLKELTAYRRRYAELTALADVWRAIDDAVELCTPEAPGPEAEGPRPTA